MFIQSLFKTAKYCQLTDYYLELTDDNYAKLYRIMAKWDFKQFFKRNLVVFKVSITNFAPIMKLWRPFFRKYHLTEHITEVIDYRFFAQPHNLDKLIILQDGFKRLHSVTYILVSIFGKYYTILVKDNNYHQFTMPSESLKFGESHESAAIRGIKEEIGLDISTVDLQYLCTTTSSHKNRIYNIKHTDIHNIYIIRKPIDWLLNLNWNDDGLIYSTGEISHIALVPIEAIIPDMQICNFKVMNSTVSFIKNNTQLII